MKRSIVCAFVALLTVAVPGGGRADALALDFEAYTPGSIHLQDGWSSFGSAGSGCAAYDHAVVDNAAAPYSYPSFGTRSLRMSNAITSGCFGDQTFSKSLTESAGETDALAGPYSVAATKSHFEATWDFASVVPDALQPGLSVVASPDRGDGARMSWVQMADTPSGLEVNFFDFQTDADGDCSDGLKFVSSNVSSGLDRSRAHSVRITMDFYAGPANDIVRVFVDGVLEHTGTSWEDYFRECEGTPESRTVDSVLFRTGGGSAPGTAGEGFLIDNLSSSSSLISSSLSATPAIAQLSPTPEAYLLTLTATLTDIAGPIPGAPVDFAAGTTPLCSATTGPSGTASCDALLSVVDVLLAGGYTASFPGDASHSGSMASGALITP